MLEHWTNKISSGFIGIQTTTTRSLATTSVSMSTERLIVDNKMQYSDHAMHLPRSSSSSMQCGEQPRIFEELPKATIVSVSRPDTSDISPMLLSYKIELHYKQACSTFVLFWSIFSCNCMPSLMCFVDVLRKEK